MIGPSLFFKGEIAGEEDLTIQGRVEGKVELRKNNVTVGKSGKVKADIYGKVIDVEGDVQGNLFGDEKVVVRQSGRVRGNMTAPRVNLEDGARFKGSIDMEGKTPDKADGAVSHSDTKASGRPEIKPMGGDSRQEAAKSGSELKFSPSASKP